MNYFDEFMNSRGYTQEMCNELFKYNIAYIKGTDELCHYLHSLPRETSFGLLSDYDCDGFMSGIVNAIGLHMLGFKKIKLVKRNVDKGYTPTKEDVDELMNYDVIITSDVGIACIDIINYAKSLGKTVIVTDHHIAPDNLCESKADFIINYRLDPDYSRNCGYTMEGAPTEYAVCGAFTVYQIFERYVSLYRSDFADYPEVGQDLMLLANFAAIATVSDMMPLLGRNRAIVKSMLQTFDSINPADGSDTAVLNVGKNGLLRNAYLNFHRLVNKLIDNYYECFDMKFLNYSVIPVINSVKRMSGEGDSVYKMLLSNEEVSFHSINYLINLNARRKETVKNLYSHLYLQGHNQLNMDLIYKEDAGAGVVGLLAAAIVNATKKPAIVLRSKLFKDESTGEYYYAGSSRSPEWFPLFSKVNASGIAHCAGHEHACAVFVPIKNVQALHDFIASEVDLHFQGLTNTSIEDEFDICIEYRKDLAFVKDIDDFMTKLNSYKPYGIGFEEPKILFKCKDNECVAQPLKAGLHTKLNLANNVAVLMWNTTEDEARASMVDTTFYLTGYFNYSYFRNVRSTNFIATPVLNRNSEADFNWG